MKNLISSKKGQRGFTLVELVVVVAVVGVLAAVATPKFMGVGDDARIAALEGVANALTAASATNYSQREAGGLIVVSVNTTDAATSTADNPAFVANAALESADAAANALLFKLVDENRALGVAVDNCDDVAASLEGGVLPSGYTVGSVALSPDVGGNQECTLTTTDEPVKTHTFLAYATPV
jgi:prepilin-type N-terminal cleavage/methylation domain-containing protein